MFLSVFKSILPVLTTPQMHLVNIQCDNVPERALHLTGEEEEYAAPIWSPYSKLQINQVEKVQRTAARWTCKRWRNTSSVSEMLDELERPSLEARRDRSSLLLFHKIHSCALSIENDKYLTPAHSLKFTRSSHSAQYCRYQKDSDALKIAFFARSVYSPCKT